LKTHTLMKAATTGLATVALSTAMFFATVPASHAADGRERCQHHIQKAELKLDEAVRRHGERSRQADERRRQLNTEREHCWNEFHSWWNGHENRWHSDRDWDR
jgi:hypothetical protein